MATLLKAVNITKRFAGLTAVDSVNLEIKEGEIVGLIGPNGAGKTTFFNSITGFYPATFGSVEFDGHNIPRKRHSRTARRGWREPSRSFSPLDN